MRDEFRNIFKIASIYIATIIGAGFASGQEIIRFFTKYQRGGFAGIMLAGFLFSIIGYFVMGKVYSSRIKSYDDFLLPSVGWLMGRIMEAVVILFQMSLYCVMLAGMGSILSERLNMQYLSGIMLMSLICMLVMFADTKGIVAVSAFTAPIMIIGMVLIGLYIIFTGSAPAFSVFGWSKTITDNWFFSSLLYVSYNSITTVVIMCSLLPYLKTKRTGTIGGALGGLVLMLIALILNIILSNTSPQNQNSEMPLLDIIYMYSNVMGIIYTIVLWMAMFSSAVSSGFCFMERINNIFNVNRKITAIVFCIAGIPLSILGFSKLIGTLYPLFGYLGMFMVIVIIIQGFKNLLYENRF